MLIFFVSFRSWYESASFVNCDMKKLSVALFDWLTRTRANLQHPLDSHGGVLWTSTVQAVRQ